jgi:hypothetical protein
VKLSSLRFKLRFLVQALGYIDDLAWSKDYAKQKWRYSKWAARRIARELRQRGIDDETIETTLEWLQTVCSSHWPATAVCDKIDRVVMVLAASKVLPF